MESKPTAAIPKKWGTCAFCSMDVVDVYTCSRCKKPFCGLKCYRSRGHAECSDHFYQEQIAQHLKLGEDKAEEVDSDDASGSEDEAEMPADVPSSSTSTKTAAPTDEKPADRSPHSKLTFAEYMHKHREEDGRKTEEEVNPELPLGPDEELVFDSDEEPEYLQEVVAGSMRDFEDVDGAELDRRLSALNFDAENEEELLKLLTPDELRSFRRLAGEMFQLPAKSCFK